MKMKGLNVELAHEYAKELIYEEDSFKINNQIQVFSEQLWRIRRLQKQCDYTITDSSILLSIIYSKEENPYFKDLVLYEYKKLNNITVFLKSDFPYKKEGRNQSEAEAFQLSDDIYKLLVDNNIPFVEINRSTALEDILEIIKNKA
jgi:hypothetical protein